jgi:hypothetical protein
MAKTLIKFYIDDDQLARLAAIKDADGVPMAEQLRRAVDLWLSKRPGPSIRSSRKRAKR